MLFFLRARPCAAAILLLTLGSPLCAQSGSDPFDPFAPPQAVPKDSPRIQIMPAVADERRYAAELNRGAPAAVGFWDHSADERITPETLPVVALAPHQRQSFSIALRALGSQAPSEFLEAPLTTVVETLKKACHCPIVIDEHALADAAIGTDTPITVSLKHVSLRTVLDETCKPHSLAWKAKAPGIVITTREQVDTNPDYRDVIVYPVRDLLGGDRIEEYDYDTVIDLITSTVHPETWRDTGTGEGIIAPMPSVAGIVITQTTEVHEAVFATLLALRDVKGRQRLTDHASHRSTRTANETANDSGRYDWQPRSSGRKRSYWLEK